MALEPFNEFKIDKDYFPLKIENEQIEIDGELDDLAWLNVKSISDFVQQHPFNLSEPSRETSVKIGWSSYSEITNGRFAMIGFLAIILIELFSQQSFLKWAGIL